MAFKRLHGGEPPPRAISYAVLWYGTAYAFLLCWNYFIFSAHLFYSRLNYAIQYENEEEAVKLIEN